MSSPVTSSTRHALIDTEIGTLTIVHDDAGLTGIYFPGHWTKPKPAVFGRRTGGSEFAEITEQLHEYLAGQRRAFELRLAPAPSERAERMRAALCALPYGTTASYGELARSMGITAREVGALNAHNPVSIVVPCHRVIGADGKLVGYAGGIERKQHLLVLEGALSATPTLWYQCGVRAPLHAGGRSSRQRPPARGR